MLCGERLFFFNGVVFFDAFRLMFFSASRSANLSCEAIMLELHPFSFATGTDCMFSILSVLCVARSVLLVLIGCER